MGLKSVRRCVRGRPTEEQQEQQVRNGRLHSGVVITGQELMVTLKSLGFIPEVKVTVAELDAEGLVFQLELGRLGGGVVF